MGVCVRGPVWERREENREHQTNGHIVRVQKTNANLNRNIERQRQASEKRHRGARILSTKHFGKCVYTHAHFAERTGKQIARKYNRSRKIFILLLNYVKWISVDRCVEREYSN